MSDTIKLRTQFIEDLVELKILLTHPMENGRNRNPVNGELIPAHFIEELLVSINGQTAMRINMAGSISKNPFFSFRLRHCKPGDRISISWLDNLGGRDAADKLIE